MPILRDLDHAATLAHNHGWKVDRSDPGRNPPAIWIQPCPNCGAFDAEVANLDGQIVVSCRGCDDPAAITRLLYTPNGATPEPVHQAHALTKLDIAAILAADPPTHEWVWDGYIERRTVTVLHGDGGTGKSILAGHLARAITTGGTCLGRPTTIGNVVIVDAENHLAEISRRLHALDFAHAPEDRVNYYRASDPILGSPDKVDVDLLTQVLEIHEANACILDSQRGVWAGDEKEAIEIRPLYRALQAMAEQLDCAVILIHHDRRMGGYSGSSDIHNAADTRLHLERPDPDKPERILHHAKARSSVQLPAAAYTFTFDQGLGQFTFTQPREPITDIDRVWHALDDDEWLLATDIRDRVGIRNDLVRPMLWELVSAGRAQHLKGPPGRSARAIGFRRLSPSSNSSQPREQSGTVAGTVPSADCSPGSPPLDPLRGRGDPGTVEHAELFPDPGTVPTSDDEEPA